MILAISCGQKKAEQFQALPFPDVVPPAMMEDPLDRAEYMAMRMWNGLLDPERNYPCDSSMVNGVRKGDVEQKFANWISILDVAGQKVAEKSISSLYSKVYACEKKDTASNVFETFTVDHIEVNTLHKIVYRLKWTILRALLNDSLRCCFANTLNGSKTKAHVALLVG